MKKTLNIFKEMFNSVKNNFLTRAKKVRPQSISLFLLLVCALLMLGLSRFWNPESIAAKVSKKAGEEEFSGTDTGQNQGGYALLGGYSSLADEFNNSERPFGNDVNGGGSLPGGNGGSGGNGADTVAPIATPEPISMSLFLLGGAALAGAHRLRKHL